MAEESREWAWHGGETPPAGRSQPRELRVEGNDRSDRRHFREEVRPGIGRARGTPLSPDPVTRSGSRELPAYVANGVIGLRVLDIPIYAGFVLISGYTGLHPRVEVDSAARAPYPIAGDIGLDGVFFSNS